MNKIRILLAVIFVIAIMPDVQALRADHFFPKCQKANYTYSTFALSWLGQFCSEISCQVGWNKNWNGKSFTIHGYWPSSTNLAYLSCQQNDGYDRYCYEPYPFDVTKLSSIEKDLNRVWPQVGRIKNFWQYQYDKHGTCYIKLTLDKFKDMKRDDIFFKYFEGAIQKFDKLNVNNISKFQFADKKALAAELKLTTDQFAAICGKDNQLDEIRVCYNLAEPEKEQIINCPGSKPKECAGKIILKQSQ